MILFQHLLAFFEIRKMLTKYSFFLQKVLSKEPEEITDRYQ